MNFLADPDLDQNTRGKKDDNFHDNFQKANNFSKANQIQLVTPDTSENDSLNQLSSLELSQINT